MMVNLLRKNQLNYLGFFRSIPVTSTKMLPKPSFGRSVFIADCDHTLPRDIPPGGNQSIIFSLKTHSSYDHKVYLWNIQQATFMLGILFLWDEISPVFSKIEKSAVYDSVLSEIYCFSLNDDFISRFDHIVEAIAHARLLLEITIEKANQIKAGQMNYLTSNGHLEQIDIYDLLTSGSKG